MVEPEVEAILSAVPEFTDRYVTLVEEADDDPGAAAAYEELASFISDRHADGEPDADNLTDRLLMLLEETAAGPDAEELVVFSFLENLPDRELAVLRPRMGARTAELLDRLDIDADTG